MHGWIKVHRKIQDTAFYKKPQYILLWIHLLLSVNHTKNEFVWNGGVVEVKQGQILTGRKQLSSETGIPETTIEDILRFFEKNQNIRQQKTTKYRLITVLNWELYQISDNRATTERQQSDTNKNDKNDKKLVGSPPTSVDPLPITPKGEDMKPYNENAHSDDLPAMDMDTREEIKPPSPKGKTRKAPDEVQQVFDLFTNPAKGLWRMREIEREAAKILFDTYGIETLRIRITRIEAEKNNKDPLFPLVTTPSQLLDKMPNVERYFGI